MITTAHDLARLVDALLGGKLLSPPLLAAMTTPQGPNSKDVEQYGYGLELVVENGAVTILGHGGADPGVSTMVSHDVVAGTTIVVLCNQDRGSWAAVTRLTKELGLTDPREVAEAQGRLAASEPPPTGSSRQVKCDGEAVAGDGRGKSRSRSRPGLAGVD